MTAAPADAAAHPPTDDVTRALMAFVRAEFQAPVAGLRGMIGMLSEDAEAAGLGTYADDLTKMTSAAQRLSDMVTLLLDTTVAQEERAASDKLRHDLRTPVTAILGYGELIAEEARERGDRVLFEPLADTLTAAANLLKELDKLVAFSSSGTSEQAGRPSAAQPSPDVFRKAAEAIGQLSRREPTVARNVVGRILIVDDNASMRDLISRRLTREGHEVSTCSSGRSALERAATGAYDLMLLDLMMPGMNGLEVMDRLRSRSETNALPVIVISALDETETAVRCIDAGADDFLSKPLNETLLRARIGSSLERKFLRDREQDALRRLQSEQERSEGLLRNVLPANVVERLRRGETVIADQLDEVTVMFCDLVGFTALSAQLPPADTLDLLNEIFSGFDRLAEENGLEKIKTIGDAYMVVGGMGDTLPDHAGRVLRMACGMAAVAASAGPGHALGVRIGIDTGPAVAGIIGRRKFFYDVWGDTVNTASRLEGTCEPGRIHVSSATRDAAADAFAFEARPPIEIRGKGLMQTYQVLV